MSAPTDCRLGPPDPSDKAAGDGQFAGVRRSGKGTVFYDGREWTRLEWIERTARNGGTLAAGEGKVLCEEIDRLRGGGDAHTHSYTPAPFEDRWEVRDVHGRTYARCLTREQALDMAEDLRAVAAYSRPHAIYESPFAAYALCMEATP